jgi:dolichol kinase
MSRLDLRAAIHAATGLVALGLGVFPSWFVLAGAIGGVVVGWVVIPMTPIEARLRRPGEPFFGGLRTYPLAVLGLVVAFLHAPSRAAAAWAVLAAGDAAASLVGRHVPTPHLLGHPKATWSGTGAFVLVGSLAAFAVGRFVESTGGGPLGPAWAPIAAAGAGALVDLVRIPPDDNVPIAAAAGAALALAAA